MADLTYYEILGVDVMASSMELMEAYLSKQVDYDESGDSDALNRLNHAYEVLSNPQSRQRYDAKIGIKSDTERTQSAPSSKVIMDTPPTTHHKDPFDVDPDAPTFYDILRVEQMATSFEILETYMILRTDYEEAADTKAAQQLQQAYTILSNQRTRERYDAELDRLGLIESPFKSHINDMQTQSKIVIDTPPAVHHKDPFDVDPDAPTFYDILRVEQMATSFEILETYMILRTDYEEAGDTKAVQQLQQAYTILSNQRTRERYDAELDRLGLIESPFEPEGDEDIYDYADSAPDNTTNNTDDSPTSLGELIFPKNKPRTSRPKRRIDGISATKDESESDE